MIYRSYLFFFFSFLFPAYVCGEQEGLIPEKAFQMGETIKATSLKLDIDEENKLVAEKLNKLKAQNVPQQDISAALKSFGVERFLCLILNNTLYVLALQFDLLWSLILRVFCNFTFLETPKLILKGNFYFKSFLQFYIFCNYKNW